MTLLVPAAQGIVEAVRDAAVAAFEALEDFQQDIAIIRTSGDTSENYDPVSGRLIGRSSTPEQVTGIITNYEAEEIDERTILVTDQRILILRSIVTGADITNEDLLLVGDHSLPDEDKAQLDIINVSVDEAGALYILQVRQTYSEEENA